MTSSEHKHMNNWRDGELTPDTLHNVIMILLDKPNAHATQAVFD